MLAGPDADTLIATALNRPLVALHVRDIGERDVMAEAALISALEDRPLIFEGLEDIEPSERGRLLRAIEQRQERTILAAPTRTAALALGERTVLLVEAANPSFAERKQAWADLSGIEHTADVAAKFRLSMTQIIEAAEVARLSATARGDATPVPSDLDLGARQASSSRLGELAARLPPGYKWEDLVVPPKQAEQLQSISAYLRHRDRVLSRLGLREDRLAHPGPEGPVRGRVRHRQDDGRAGDRRRARPGDLPRRPGDDGVSKYIGETEKNLDRIFGAAEGSNAILFFDEADALFGKRSEVGDSHDRYANIEVAYLLQKMEGYPGAVILATNFRRNIDDAFVRRLDFVIDFPFPEPEDRMRIWDKVLPPEAPRADDIDLDVPEREVQALRRRDPQLLALGRLPGRRRRQPDRDAPPRAAVASEYGKQGRLTLEADFERFHDIIRVGGGKTAARSN